jgi:hypothetical protein
MRPVTSPQINSSASAEVVVLHIEEVLELGQRIDITLSRLELAGDIARRTMFVARNFIFESLPNRFAELMVLLSPL